MVASMAMRPCLSSTERLAERGRWTSDIATQIVPAKGCSKQRMHVFFEDLLLLQQLFGISGGVR